MPPDPLTDIDDEVDAYVARWGTGRWDQTIKRLVTMVRAGAGRVRALEDRADLAEARLTALEGRVSALERARP